MTERRRKVKAKTAVRSRRATPQGSRLFRVVAVLSRMQVRYLIRNSRNPTVLIATFAVFSGASALILITWAAHVLDLPLLFPPLWPTAFILFYTPMAASASPRNTIQAHTLGVGAGLLSLWSTKMVFPSAQVADASSMDWQQVAAITLAMVLISIVMIGTRSIHPPAAASSLIAAMGYLSNPKQMLGLPAAVVLLVLLAILLNRLVGGLPYPLWRADPNAGKLYGILAGNPDRHTSYWRQLNDKLYQRRD